MVYSIRLVLFNLLVNSIGLVLLEGGACVREKEAGILGPICTVQSLYTVKQKMGRCVFSSDDIVVKSPSDRRLYRVIQLKNGLTALIVHDPEIYPDGPPTEHSEAEDMECEDDDCDEDESADCEDEDEEDEDEDDEEEEEEEGEENEVKGKGKEGAAQTKKV